MQPGLGSLRQPLLIAVVTNTWSSHTTGELQPAPGISIQTMFSAVLNVQEAPDRSPNTHADSHGTAASDR
jgi:hypothetical protein